MVVAGVNSSHRLARIYIFSILLASGQEGPAAAAGLSLVIGIVMAEVLRELGADKFRVVA